MKPPYYVKRTSQNIQIDGTASHPAWREANLLADFTFPWLDRPAPQTHFRALWDEENFYFLYEVEDADIVLLEKEDLKDEVLASDRVELFFTQDDSLRNYFCLEIDPKARVYDYKAQYYRQFNKNWQWPGLQTASSRTTNGYIVEGIIPMVSFDELGLIHEENGQRYLKAGAYRGEFSHKLDGSILMNWISWVKPDSEKPDFHIPSSFGRFVLETV